MPPVVMRIVKKTIFLIKALCNTQPAQVLTFIMTYYSCLHRLCFKGPPRCDGTCCRDTEEYIQGERCDAPGCFESCVDDSSYHDDTVEI